MSFKLLFGNDLAAFCPELFLATSLLVVLLHGVFLGSVAASLRTYLTPSMVRITSAIFFLSLVLVLNNPVAPQALWNGFFITDFTTAWAKCLVILGLSLCLPLCESYMFYASFRSYEFFVFLLGVCLSLCLLVSSNDLLSIYLSVEFLSLLFYILATWKKSSFFSAEAGLKYFIMGSLASLFYLFGASLLYFSFGTTSLGAISILTEPVPIVAPYTHLALILIGAALLFKLGAAPYHMWIADIYEGSPTIVSYVFAVVPKIGIFVLLLRLAFVSTWVFFTPVWEDFFSIAGILSVLFGSLCGLGETKVKRLLAFSGVGHMGFLCLGLSTGTIEGIQAVLFYLTTYMVTSAFLWLVVLQLGSNKVSIRITDLIGLTRSNPLLGFTVILIVFSLAGIPPLAGFFAKFNIFICLVNSSFIIAAVLSVLSSVLSAFYYIRLVKILSFEGKRKWLYFPPIPKGSALSLVLTGFTVIFFISSPSLLYLITNKVTLSIFS
uniref:Nad2 n=1 Tax=Phaeophyceae sp. TaxID=2249243 RepID=A0A8E8PDN6_9PHAE|nr:Nad2 [Phaeophyceae sp.]